MSLNGAIQVGRSAITVAQAGLQVAGNNMANAATPGFSRQVATLTPAMGQSIGRGHQTGLGVQLTQISRQVDIAIQGRLRDAISDQSGALVNQRFLTSIESLQNELTDNDLSSLLSQFFNTFSELANNPLDTAIRSLAVQQGVTLSDRIAQMRSDYNRVRDEVDRDLNAAVREVNDLLGQVAALNKQIAQSEHGVGVANSLRDQRDQLIDKIAEFMDVTAIEQPNGMVNLLVGSLPVVVAGESRGIELRTKSIEGELQVSVRIAADGSNLRVQSGRIGALMQQRTEVIDDQLSKLDAFASQLIFEVNRLHAQGQSGVGRSTFEGAYRVEDPTANLNAAATRLPYRIENGSFFIHITHAETGVRTAHQITVDGDSMSMNDLIAQINSAVPNLNAGISATNGLRLDAAAGYELSFSDDSSGALAALGINTYFTGSDSSDIGVSALLRENPQYLAAGSGHVAGSNGTAMAIAGLQDTKLESLSGRSLREFWQQTVNDLSVRTAGANQRVQATMLVRENLHAQAQSVSGVSLDEETINLMAFQRQFQAAARFISVIDETIQTLLSLA